MNTRLGNLPELHIVSIRIRIATIWASKSNKRLQSLKKKRIETIDINVELHAYMTSFTSLEQGHRSAFTDRSVDPHRLRNP